MTEQEKKGHKHIRDHIPEDARQHAKNARRVDFLHLIVEAKGIGDAARLHDHSGLSIGDDPGFGTAERTRRFVVWRIHGVLSGASIQDCRGELPSCLGMKSRRRRTNKDYL